MRGVRQPRLARWSALVKQNLDHFARDGRAAGSSVNPRIDSTIWTAHDRVSGVTVDFECRNPATVVERYFPQSNLERHARERKSQSNHLLSFDFCPVFKISPMLQTGR